MDGWKDPCIDIGVHGWMYMYRPMYRYWCTWMDV